MAFSAFEQKRYENIVGQYIDARRPEPSARKDFDLGFRISGQSVEIFEIRPHFQDRSNIIETPVAKATYVRPKDTWSIFWMRADLKWHSYEPDSSVKTLDDVIKVIDKDEFCCFWG